MQDVLDVFNALSDGNRVRALYAMRTGELCVGEITEMLGLAPSTVSKHLLILRKAGLIRGRKDGRWVYYALADDPEFPMIGKLLPVIFQALEKTSEIRADKRTLTRDLKKEVER